MTKKLEREISRLHPELSADQVEELADDIQEYWIDACLQDVLEAIL